MNRFGGDWTEKKIEILVEYAIAYLQIMNTYAARHNWKLLYFDGFAGSGLISKGKAEDQKDIVGAAKRILDIEQPRAFDLFYFVEKNFENANKLREVIKQDYPHKDAYVVNEDCNNKIIAMSRFLAKQRDTYKALAYIDPYGMQLNWSSLQTLEQRSVDVWILIPTGIGVNRLLKNDAQISEAWLSRLEVFLGMTKEEILPYFYKEKTTQTLFGEDKQVLKEAQAIEKAAVLYKERLGTLFKFVSNTYALKNRSNSTMFHFLMASNNRTAVNIANDIIDKYNKVT